MLRSEGQLPMSDGGFPSRTWPSLLVRLKNPGRRGGVLAGMFLLPRPLVYRCCRRHGLQDADAHDVSQEVLLQLVAALRTFDYQRECVALL